jgi:hypothetical protein
MLKEKIGFKDLTLDLQILYILAWIYIGLIGLSFIAGFTLGVMGI